MKKYTNWKNLSYLVLRDRRGKEWVYNSIADFVWDAPDLDSFKARDHTEKVNGEYCFFWGADYSLFDESGLKIPVEVIAGFLEHFPEKPARNWRHWRIGTFEYRRGPVQGIRNWPASKRRYHRNGYSYFQEKKNNIHLLFDEDCIEHNIKPRGKRLGLWTEPWNDFPWGRTPDNWKRYRKHQWKD